SRLRGPVDGQNDLHRLATFPAVYGWSCTGFNGPDKIGQLPRMPDMRNRRRVTGTARRSDLLSEALFDDPIVGSLRRKVPPEHILLLDDNCAAVAVDGDGLGQAGVG